ncbi:MAG: hypothetical protein FWE32_10315 [Oscillospiraceae bacterium]|nr:hypothetical protein [Oscillospiraceae bacterium]
MEDNKVLYTNTFTPTREDIREYVVHLFPKRSLLIFFTVFGSLGLMFVVWWQLTVIGLITNQLTHMLAAVILIIAVMHIDRGMKRAAVSRMERKHIRQMGGAIVEVHNIFYEDQVESNGKVFKYLDFANVYYGEECAYLVTKDKQMVMIKDAPDAITTASETPLWDFLNDRCKGVEGEKKKKGIGLSFFTQ